MYYRCCVCDSFTAEKAQASKTNSRKKVAERIPESGLVLRARRVFHSRRLAPHAQRIRGQRTYEAEILRVDIYIYTIYVLARVLAIGVNCAPNAIYFHRDGCSARTRFASARGLVNAVSYYASRTEIALQLHFRD